MPQSQGKANRSNRALAVLAGAALVISGPGLTPTASATFPPTAAVTFDHALRTRPFLGSDVASSDMEGSAYVPRDNSLWLADDDGRSLYEVNPRTGALKRRIGGIRLADVEELGGGPRAGKSRTQEIQALAYDPTSDTLYAFSGTCCPPDINSTAFRLTRRAGRLRLDSFQALPPGLQVEGAAWNPCDGRVYVGSHTALWSYSYARNIVGTPFGIPGVSHLYGMDFTEDGKDLFIAQPYTKVTRVDWATRTIVPGWDLDLAAFGPLDVRAVEVIGERLWVSDGSDQRPLGDPLDHAVLVFGVGGTPVPPKAPSAGKNLVGNAGFERDVCGWDTTLARANVSLVRVPDGHTGSWAARVKRIKGKGDIRLASVPTWVVKNSSRTYKGRLWVRSRKPGSELQLRLQERDGEREVSKSVTRVELTKKWQRVTVSLRPRSSGSRIYYAALVRHARPGTSFVADNARLTVS